MYGGGRCALISVVRKFPLDDQQLVGLVQIQKKNITHLPGVAISGDP